VTSVLVFFVLYLFPMPLPSGDASVYVKRFENRYRAGKTLQATFLERYFEGDSIVRTEAGIAYFRRPGKMRWEYESPERDVFLVDGKLAWFYVPADHTVMRVPAKQSTDWRTPLALLAGEMKVSRVCSRVELAHGVRAENADNVMLRCLLRGADNRPSQDPDPQATPGGGTVDAVFFEVGRESGELARLLVRQAGGVQVEFRFANWRMDPPVADSMFHFEVPPGVAIVNGELPAEDAVVK
jgi:outer membrane lipoprotein carrier protein